MHAEANGQLKIFNCADGERLLSQFFCAEPNWNSHLSKLSERLAELKTIYFINVVI